MKQIKHQPSRYNLKAAPVTVQHELPPQTVPAQPSKIFTAIDEEDIAGAGSIFHREMDPTRRGATIYLFNRSTASFFAQVFDQGLLQVNGAIDHLGTTPLLYLAGVLTIWSVPDDDLRTKLIYLLDHGADPNLANLFNESPVLIPDFVCFYENYQLHGSLTETLIKKPASRNRGKI